MSKMKNAPYIMVRIPKPYLPLYRRLLKIADKKALSMNRLVLDLLTEHLEET